MLLAVKMPSRFPMAYKVRLEDLIDVGAQVAEEDDYPHPKQIRVKGLLLL